MKVALVSACLLGLKTRHDGTDALSKDALKELEGLAVIPVCPEQLGGLPTPRPAATIENGSGADVLDGRCRVTDERGVDVTKCFLKGAEAVVRIAGITKAGMAILKEKSPSCGLTHIYTPLGKLKEGTGVTAALLARKGFVIKGF